MHLPTVVFLAPSAVCVLSWLGAGLLVPGRLLAGETLLDWLTRLAAGSVVVSLVVLALGRLGALDRALLIGLTVAGALAGLVALARLLRDGRRSRPVDRLGAVLAAAVGLAILVDLVAATAPVSSADALKYHLALPKLWLQTGSIGDPFWRWEGFNPSGIEMLYTQGLALGGGSAAAPLHAVFAALCALAIFGLGRELGRASTAGAVAAFLFVLQGIVTWEATSAFVELGIAFYLTLAVWHGLRWARAPSWRGALWTGALSGAAAGTKYLGLVGAAIVVGGFALAALRVRRGGEAALAAGAAVLVGGAWYLKNLVATGNPFYPFVFGGRLLTPAAKAVIRDDLGGYGVPAGLPRLLILPVDLLVHSGAFDRGRYVGTAIFLLALLALVTARRAATFLLLAGVAVYAVAWELQSPQARFLLPALAVLAALAGAGAAPWLAAGGARRGLVAALLAVSALAWLGATAALTRQLLPVAFGAETRAAALERLTGTYDAFRAARTRAGPGTVALAGYPYPFNFPGRAVTLDVPEFVPGLTRREFMARARSLGIVAVLVGGTSPPQLDPVRDCLSELARYHARLVTSRSLGHSTPYDLTLDSLVGCGR